MEHAWIKTEPKPEIRTITDERLVELMGSITPLVQKEDGSYWTFDPVDPRTQSMTWSPKYRARVGFEPIVTVSVLFPCGYYGFFKPSVAEVLAYCPDDLEGIDSFCIDTSRIDIDQSGSFQRGDVWFGALKSA